MIKRNNRAKEVEEEERKQEEALLKGLGGLPPLKRKPSSYQKSAADLRLEKDFEELDLPPNV